MLWIFLEKIKKSGYWPAHFCIWVFWGACNCLASRNRKTKFEGEGGGAASRKPEKTILYRGL